MKTYQDVLDFVEEENVKFIRLAYFDVFGEQKNIAIMPGELRRAFTEGISIDASAVAGFGDDLHSDLFLRPDPSTISMVPWRPMDGGVCRMFCDIFNPDGTPFEKDTRYILKQAVKAARDRGIRVNFGPEIEFYVFRRDEQGNPTDIPIDHASYMAVEPFDKGENLRRDVCFALIDMGITPEASHHEQGPGQNEIDFHYSEPLTAADNTVTVRWAIRNLAQTTGMWADFSPKPMREHPGSGMHFNISVEPVQGETGDMGTGTGSGAAAGGKTPDYFSMFMAGILKHIREITLFLNPVRKSYERFGQMEAPYYVSWSEMNRSQLIRIPATNGGQKRMELRSPDPTCNPYLAFALVIFAGLDGIDNAMRPERPMNVNLYKADPDLTGKLEKLPRHIEEAASYARGSEFVHEHVPQEIIDAYCSPLRMA